MDTIVICTLSGLTLLLALDAETINYGINVPRPCGKV